MNDVFELAVDDSDVSDFERRRHARRPLDVGIIVDEWRASLVDLSVKGACVRMVCAPEVGEVVELEFELDHVVVRAMALVRRVEADRSTTLVGLEFVWAPRRMTEALRAAFSGRCAA